MKDRISRVLYLRALSKLLTCMNRNVNILARYVRNDKNNPDC